MSKKDARLEFIRLIAESPDPETMPGAHLTSKGRAALAFATLYNFREKARDLLHEKREPLNIGEYIDANTDD